MRDRYVIGFGFAFFVVEKTFERKRFEKTFFEFVKLVCFGWLSWLPRELMRKCGAAFPLVCILTSFCGRVVWLSCFCCRCVIFIGVGDMTPSLEE